MKLLQQHRNIFQAVAKGNSQQAREYMHEHIDFVREETSQFDEYARKE